MLGIWLTWASGGGDESELALRLGLAEDGGVLWRAAPSAARESLAGDSGRGRRGWVKRGRQEWASEARAGEGDRAKREQDKTTGLSVRKTGGQDRVLTHSPIRGLMLGEIKLLAFFDLTLRITVN
jgi:hypothetical protein